MNDNNNGNGNKNGSGNGWPAATVAVMLILLVGSVTIAAILKYGTTGEALQVWSALTGIVGVLTGAFVTYFFTQGTVSSVKDQQAKTRERADTAERAFRAVVGQTDRNELNRIRQEEPAVRKALD